MIKKPGIYPDFSIDDYYADPCPKPSITQSLAKVLLERSPSHAWCQHPRLNQKFERDDEKKFDLGGVAHKLMFGRGREIEVIKGFDNWRKKKAGELRDIAIEEGRLPCLEHVYEQAQTMVASAKDHLKHFWAPELGHSEICIAWKENETWCRQLVDWLDTGYLMFLDYKTTEASAAPSTLGNRMIDAGWHIQAAMCDRGLGVLKPEHAGYRRYLFAVQECQPPYAMCIAEIGEAALDLGRKMIDHAIAVWTECLERQQWPGYPRDSVVPMVPAWHINRVLELELPTFTRPDSSDWTV